MLAIQAQENGHAYDRIVRLAACHQAARSRSERRETDTENEWRFRGFANRGRRIWRDQPLGQASVDADRIRWLEPPSGRLAEKRPEQLHSPYKETAPISLLVFGQVVKPRPLQNQ